MLSTGQPRLFGKLAEHIWQSTLQNLQFMPLTLPEHADHAHTAAPGFHWYGLNATTDQLQTAISESTSPNTNGGVV